MAGTLVLTVTFKHKNLENLSVFYTSRYVLFLKALLTAFIVIKSNALHVFIRNIRYDKNVVPFHVIMFSIYIYLSVYSRVFASR